MAVDVNSFICKRPFFANKQFTFANLSRTRRLSFAGSHVKIFRYFFAKKIARQESPNSVGGGRIMYDNVDDDDDDDNDNVGDDGVEDDDVADHDVEDNDVEGLSMMRC